MRIKMLHFGENLKNEIEDACVGNVQKNGAATNFNSIISLAAGKDKNGSAPSYKGEFLFIKKDKEQEEAAA